MKAGRGIYDCGDVSVTTARSARLMNSSLWKRVIAWERSPTASGYGIIWGQTRRNLDNQKSRELRRIRTMCSAVYL